MDVIIEAACGHTQVPRGDASKVVSCRTWAVRHYGPMTADIQCLVVKIRSTLYLFL